jgi:hypothetical protein
MPRNTSTRLTRAAVSVLAIALMTVAFLRGNHLLGFDVGIAYVLVVAVLLWLLGESFRRKGVAAIIQMIAVTMIAILIGFALAFPASINPDVQHFINKHTTDRSVRKELRHVFNSDSAFGDLSVSTTHLKVVNVTIHGSLPTRDEMKRLRERLITDCPTLKLCPLHWDIRLRDTNERVDGLDSALFPSAT